MTTDRVSECSIAQNLKNDKIYEGENARKNTDDLSVSSTIFLRFHIFFWWRCPRGCAVRSDFYQAPCALLHRARRRPTAAVRSRPCARSTCSYKTAPRTPAPYSPSPICTPHAHAPVRQYIPTPQKPPRRFFAYPVSGYALIYVEVCRFMRCLRSVRPPFAFFPKNYGGRIAAQRSFPGKYKSAVWTALSFQKPISAGAGRETIAIGRRLRYNVFIVF